jgi:hypothetical protein
MAVGNTISVQCAKCHAEYTITAAAAGTKANCPDCAATIEIPKSSADESLGLEYDPELDGGLKPVATTAEPPEPQDDARTEDELPNEIAEELAAEFSSAAQDQGAIEDELQVAALPESKTLQPRVPVEQFRKESAAAREIRRRGKRRRLPESANNFLRRPAIVAAIVVALLAIVVTLVAIFANF